MVRTGTPNGGHDEVTRLKAAHRAAGLGHNAKTFMPKNQPVKTLGRIAVIKTTDFTVGAANADLEHAKLNLCGRGDLRRGLIDDPNGALLWIYGNSFHCNWLSAG